MLWSTRCNARSDMAYHRFPITIYLFAARTLPSLRIGSPFSFRSDDGKLRKFTWCPLIPSCRFQVRTVQVFHKCKCLLPVGLHCDLHVFVDRVAKNAYFAGRFHLIISCTSFSDLKILKKKKIENLKKNTNTQLDLV